MLVKAIEVGYLQTNCYIVTDENTMDTAIIDPGADSNVILDYIERSRMHPRAILITHGHFDHTKALETVWEELRLPVYMSEKDLGIEIGNGEFILDPPEETVFVSEGDEIEAGSLCFTVLETPGHTPGGLTYRIEDCLFTGDTLFRLSIGRYDFPGSSSLQLSQSLEKLRALPGDYEVFPGHESSTTLEYERRFNPYVQRPWDL